jgi:hypothetical protein
MIAAAEEPVGFEGMGTCDTWDSEGTHRTRRRGRRSLISESKLCMHIHIYIS